MTALAKLVILLVAVLAVSGKSLRLRRLAPLAQIARNNEFPHQVSIQRDGVHHCGGALISTRHVLTAAHCVHDWLISPEPSYYKGQRLVVEVGSTRIGGGTIHAVKRISQIRQYDGANPVILVPNDIAVITLKTPVTESASVRVINLPAASSEIPDNSQVTISGFGNAYVGGPTSNVLKKSPMYIVANAECNDYFTSRHNKAIISSHICAKLGHGSGTCEGDSGGPLIQGNTVIGIVSGGSGMCDAGHPDVYTKVSHYISYINYELNYKSEDSETGDSPAFAVNVPEATVQSAWQPPTEGNIQYMDPYTGEILPQGSVILVDPITGVPITPMTSQFPQIPLYPIYIDPASGLVIG